MKSTKNNFPDKIGNKVDDLDDNESWLMEKRMETIREKWKKNGMREMIVDIDENQRSIMR